MSIPESLSQFADCTYLTSLLITGDAVRHLHNLTPAMRLDYYNFVNDYDQTFFYAAQQLEGGLKDYTPQIVLVRNRGGGRRERGGGGGRERNGVEEEGRR